jgi:hypothetical protein
LCSSQEEKTLKLLENTVMEDEKPSQYLRRLQALARSAVPTDLLRTRWMRGLPEKLKPTMATQTGKTLTDMAEVGDTVFSLLPGHSAIYKVMVGANLQTLAGLCGIEMPDGRIAQSNGGDPKWKQNTFTATVASAFTVTTAVKIALASTCRRVLVPLSVQGPCQEMYLTLCLNAGKPLGQSLVAADMCPTTSRRLFVRDKPSGIQFFVDTGADICVFPRNLLHGPRRKSDYALSAANGTQIVTYGTHMMALNLGLRRDFRWRFLVADVYKPILGEDFLSHYNLLPDLTKGRLLDSTTLLTYRGEVTK